MYRKECVRHKEKEREKERERRKRVYSENLRIERERREKEREEISRRLVVALGKGHLLVTETNRTGYVPGGGSARKGNYVCRLVRRSRRKRRTG